MKVSSKALSGRVKADLNGLGKDDLSKSASN